MNEIGYEIRLSNSYEESIILLTKALKEEGFGVLTEIDVKNTLNTKLGVNFRKYKIIGACNPPLAYKALSEIPEIGLLLPCNATVEEDDNRGSVIRLLDPKIMIGFGGLSQSEIIKEVANDAHDRIKRIATKLAEMSIDQFE